MTDSDPWLAAWGKTNFDRDAQRITHWLPLFQHVEDSAAIAELLLRQWVPPRVLDLIARDLPGGVADVYPLARWLAGAHDTGKISPAFSAQVPELFLRMDTYGLSADGRIAHDPQRSAVSHSLVGHLAVREWLADTLGFARPGPATQLASVVGSHHGVAPEKYQLINANRLDYLSGTGAWHRARAMLLDHVTARTGVSGTLEKLRDRTLSLPSLVLLSGIVIVADWIASSDNFPLEPLHTAGRPPAAPDPERTSARAREAWDRLALPQPWLPAAPDTDVDTHLRSRFPKITRANAMQLAAGRIARELPEPELMIIEAPMGNGKTEAALGVAEVFAHRFGASGCVFALPTQATSDAMFERVLHWLEALPPNADGAPLDVNLAHGKASLNDRFRGLLFGGGFARIDECEGHRAANVAAHEWMSGSKKALLASFVIGTIDQILFMALKSRHLMLRHLGLAGKVVIIDEVHAYDVFMSRFLHRALHWLAAYRVPVILLSATLPAGQRDELLRAYAGGRGEQGEHTGHEDHDELAYPLITTSGGVREVVPHSSGTTTVRLDQLADDRETLLAYLGEHLADGGCAVVIRNTVARVQETADWLAEEFGTDRVTVNHARFLACERARKDRSLVERFGPPGAHTTRPELHIVVASQVVEQSLDVDFDLMVCDLAPMDLVLQRLGRLHRHQRNRPVPVAEARCALTGIEDWTAAPPTAPAAVRKVYSRHTLLRAAALLHERKEIRLPDDIAPLVQEAYGARSPGPESWKHAMAEAAREDQQRARERIDRAGAFLLGTADRGTAGLLGWQQANVGETEGPRGAAKVRDGEDTLEVLVVQRDGAEGLLVPQWIAEHAGCQLPLYDPLPYWLARVVAACSLRLPMSLSHPGVIESVIGQLENNRFLSFEQTPLLKGQLVLALDENRQATLHTGTGTVLLTYDPDRGLLDEKQ